MACYPIDEILPGLHPAHMDVMAESAKVVFDKAAQTHGLKMVYEPKYLRFFQARFERP